MGLINTYYSLTRCKRKYPLLPWEGIFRGGVRGMSTQEHRAGIERVESLGVAVSIMIRQHLISINALYKKQIISQ